MNRITKSAANATFTALAICGLVGSALGAVLIIVSLSL